MSKFENFAEEVKATSVDVRRGCGVKALLDNLADADANQVKAVLEDRTVSARAIFNALRSRIGGDAPSIYTIGRHRAKNCNCWRAETKG